MASIFEPKVVDGKAQGQIDELRKSYQSLVMDIYGLCPDSREKSLAITKLEESSMWAIKSITHGGK